MTRSRNYIAAREAAPRLAERLAGEILPQPERERERDAETRVHAYRAGNCTRAHAYTQLLVAALSRQQ